MTKFNVPEMTCNHCKASIEKAIKGIDETARIDVDLDAKTVFVEGAGEDAALISAMKEAGYQAIVIG
ncbi:MAG: copper chaperone [Rhodobacteraceae bacterium]|nr:copper chaperone [Paracoccaceae bacterium]